MGKRESHIVGKHLCHICTVAGMPESQTASESESQNDCSVVVSV